MDLLGRARTLVRIVEAGSLSAAARSSKISLAAVSRQITSLEAEVGVRLLARTSRSLELTDAGRRFYGHARRLVQEADDALESIAADATIRGRVVMSTSVSMGLLRIVPALHELVAAHPRLDLELRLEERAADVIREGVDVAVRAGLTLPDTTNLVALPLARFERFVVAGPSYLRRRGTPRTITSLAEHDAVVGLDSAGAWAFVEDGEPRTVDVRPRLRVGTLMGIRSAAASGLGIAILPDFVVADDLEQRTLRRLLPNATLAPVEAHALHRVELRATPRVQAVIVHLRKTLPFEVRR